MSDVAEKILELRKSGVSIKQIEKQLGCSRSTVSKWCAVLVPNNANITKEILENRRVAIKKRNYDRELLAHQITRSNADSKRVWTIATREAAKFFLLEAAGGQCQVCGYNSCIACLSFHHLDVSKKDFELNGMRLTYSLEKLIKEASKCALLCRNCHGEQHNGIQKTLTPIDFSKVEIPQDLLRWYKNKMPMVGFEPTRDLSTTHD